MKEVYSHLHQFVAGSVLPVNIPVSDIIVSLLLQEHIECDGSTSLQFVSFDVKLVAWKSSRNNPYLHTPSEKALHPTVAQTNGCKSARFQTTMSRHDDVSVSSKPTQTQLQSLVDVSMGCRDQMAAR